MHRTRAVSIHAINAALVASMAVSMPRVATACAVCSANSNDPGQSAFFFGSVFLSLLPLALIGGAVFYLVRRARKLAIDDDTPGSRSSLDSRHHALRVAPAPGRPAASRAGRIQG